MSEDGRPWRDHVAAYNTHYQKTGENPFGLHMAGALYGHPRYQQLMRHYGSERLYILSAGWGLVRSDYLLPNYDVTFSQASNGEPFALRRNDHGWADWSMLDVPQGADLIFVGSRRYLPQFARLTARYRGRRLAYFNSQIAPVVSGVELRRFDTSTKTNWHYALAEKLLGGGASLKGAPQTLQAKIADRLPKTDVSTQAGARRGLYAPLTDYLKAVALEQKSVTLSFPEIETILGRPLPKSAQAYIGVWWSNGHHSQSAGWMDAGFRKVGHYAAADRKHCWVRFEHV